MSSERLFFAGKVKARPVNASSTQMPFWNSSGNLPSATGMLFAPGPPKIAPASPSKNKVSRLPSSCSSSSPALSPPKSMRVKLPFLSNGCTKAWMRSVAVNPRSMSRFIWVAIRLISSRLPGPPLSTTPAAVRQSP